MEKKPKSKARRVVGKIVKWLLIVVLVVVLLAGGFIGWLTIREYDPDPLVPAEVGSTELNAAMPVQRFRVVSMNTGYGGLDCNADFFMDGGESVTPESEERVRENVEGIGATLQRLDADIYFLQEVDTDSKRSYGMNQWQSYEQKLSGFESRYAMNYACDYVPFPFPDTIGKVHSGVVTLANAHMTEGTRYALPCPFSWPVRVANLKRCMLVTRVPVENGRELVLVNFHLEAYDDGEGKELQTRQLMEFMQAEYDKGNYVIAGGDFNQSFPGVNELYPIKPNADWAPGELSELPEGWSYAYDAAVPTTRVLNQPLNKNPERDEFYVIDGFITSPNLSVESVQTVDEGFRFSDHNPVLMEVGFAE